MEFSGETYGLPVSDEELLKRDFPFVLVEDAMREVFMRASWCIMLGNVGMLYIHGLQYYNLMLVLFRGKVSRRGVDYEVVGIVKGIYISFLVKANLLEGAVIENWLRVLLFSIFIEMLCKLDLIFLFKLDIILNVLVRFIPFS